MGMIQNDINNINVSLPNNQSGMYLDQVQQMPPMGYQGGYNRGHPIYSGQHNLAPQDYNNAPMDNQYNMMQQNNQQR